MATETSPPPTQPAATHQAATTNQLPEPAEGLVGRMLEQTQALGEDVVSLVELRLKKTQIEVEEKLDEKANALVANAAMGVLLAVGGLFLLIAAALGLGDLLGHPAWGFVIVGVVLALSGFIVKKAQPDVVKVGDKKAVIEEKKLAPDAPQGRPAHAERER